MTDKSKLENNIKKSKFIRISSHKNESVAGLDGMPSLSLDEKAKKISATAKFVMKPGNEPFRFDFTPEI